MNGLREFLLAYSKKVSSFYSAIRFYLKIGLFYPSGEPILLHLLPYRALAVDDHSCVPCVSHLGQPWLVNNPGEIIRINWNFYYKEF